MTADGEFWFEDRSGPLVRPYAVTRGRTTGVGNELDMLTLVHTAAPGPGLRRTEPEYHEIIQFCRTPVSIAEVSAWLGRPLAVCKILVGDLVADGNLHFRAPLEIDHRPDELDALRAIQRALRRL